MGLEDKSRTLWAQIGIFVVIGLVGLTTLAGVVVMLESTAQDYQFYAMIILNLLSLALLAPLMVTLHRTAYRRGGIVLGFDGTGICTAR